MKKICEDLKTDLEIYESFIGSDEEDRKVVQLIVTNNNGYLTHANLTRLNDNEIDVNLIYDDIDSLELIDELVLDLIDMVEQMYVDNDFKSLPAVS